MGELKNKRIVQSRNWLDPNPQPIPDFDYEEVFPISIYDAIKRDMEDNSPNLADELNSIYRLIADKQDIIQPGVPGQLMTWTGIQGQIGSMETIKSINPDPSLRSNKKIPTERAVGDALDTKASLASLVSHTNDNSIHVNDVERTRWNSMAPKSSLEAHISNATMHITNDERSRWNDKADASDLDGHLYNTDNPHNVSAHQVGTYTRKEVDDMFASLRESFFNYLNISWDDRSNTAELVQYHPANWNPNYVLAFNDPLPDVTDATQTYFALKPATDYSVNESEDCIIFIKRPGLTWQEVGSTAMSAGDMIIKFPDTVMYVWMQGRFIRLFSDSSGEPEDGLNGNVWKPSVDADGNLSWELSKDDTVPTPVKIKGEDGYTPIKGIDYDDGKDGEGVPIGGTQSDILIKLSDENYDTTWKSLIDLMNDLALSGTVLPDNIINWDGINGRPNSYDGLGPNEDGYITQKGVTKEFENVNNQITEILTKVDGPTGIESIRTDLYDHINDYNNPHRVTPAIIGAVSVNTFTDHTQNFDNPHNVNKEQVGLGNVDNTSDLDKPISNSTQIVLDSIKEKIKDIDDGIAASKYIVDVTWDSNTNNLEFEFKDGDKLSVTIPITETFNNISFDATTKELVIILPDGTENRINISALIQTYYGSVGNHIQVTIEDDNVIKASIVPGTIGEYEITPSVNLRMNPTTNTQVVGDRSTRIATTEFVANQIINNLISYETDRGLSANMGRVLNQNKADIEDVIQIINDLEGIEVIDTLDSTNPLAALSANMGRYLDLVKAPRVHTSPSGATFGRATISLFGHVRASEVDPLMDGTVFRGTDDGRYSRADHRHPTDITRAPIHFPDVEHGQDSFTGEPKTTTPPDDSNDTRIPTTEWVRKNTPGVYKGFSSTEGNINIKIVKLKSDYMENVNFLRQTGSTVVVTFDYTDISNGITQLDVQGSGAAPVIFGGLNVVPNMISAKHSHSFTFDGTNWRLINPTGIHTLQDADNSNRFVSSEWVRRNIPGVLWGVCDTAEATAVKVATIRSTYVANPVFTRQIGSTVVIKFTHGDNSSAPTQLNVHNTGAAPVVYENRAVIPYMIDKDLDHMFTFDGTNWRLINPSTMGTEIFGGTSTGAANQMTEYLGFTVDGYGGSTNAHGEVNRVLFTIPFKTHKPQGAKVTISTNAADWAARMGDNSLINLTSPVVLFTSRKHAVVQFAMASVYPSNSPCSLVARRPQASIKIESDSSPVPFVAVTGIPNIPASISVGNNLNLNQFQVSPINATNQTIVWNIQNVGTTGAAITSGILSVAASGSFTLRATVVNGASATTNFVKDFTISAIAAAISITSQPAATTNVIFGKITKTLTVEASIIKGTLSYQWYTASSNTNVGGTAISGATNKTFSIPTNLTAGTHYYFCEIRASGGAAPVRSNVATVKVSVEATGVVISPKPSTMIEFSSVQLHATVSPSNVTNSAVVWSSSNTSVANITTSGLVTANNAGSATITATTVDGGYKDSFVINISAFVPVTTISGIGNTMYANSPMTLTPTIVPNNATHKNIEWSVMNANNTDATISGNVLNVTSNLLKDTEVIIRARITDGSMPNVPYIQDFLVMVKPDYIGITDIILNGGSAVTRAKEPLALNTVFVPFNATYQSIVWTIVSAVDSTGNPSTATISGDNLIPNVNGTVTIKATVKNGATKNTDYVKEFTITVTDELIPVSSIDGVPTSIYAGYKTRSLDPIISPSTATNTGIEFTIIDQGTTGALFDADDESLYAPNTGTFVLQGTIREGKWYNQNYVEQWNVSVIGFTKVADIIDLPKEFMVGETLSLSGTVTPANASYKDIVWSIANDGGTNSSLSGNILTATNTGTVTIQAEIACGVEPYGLEDDDPGYDPTFNINYIKKFDITVTPPQVKVTIEAGYKTSIAIGIVQPDFEPFVKVKYPKNIVETELKVNTTYLVRVLCDGDEYFENNRTGLYVDDVLIDSTNSSITQPITISSTTKTIRTSTI